MLFIFKLKVKYSKDDALCHDKWDTLFRLHTAYKRDVFQEMIIKRKLRNFSTNNSNGFHSVTTPNNLLILVGFLLLLIVIVMVILMHRVSGNMI